MRARGLERDFKLNIDANHATLAGHPFSRELHVAAGASVLGSFDANRGAAQNGSDTDQIPTDLYQITDAMMILLASGGLNFEAELQRNSTNAEALFLAHIRAMDAFARGLEIAAKLLATRPFS